MQVKTEKPDADMKDVVPLCTYGRDEKYITNKLWQTGASTILLSGVGDGMIPWCALKARIPIMCLYDKEIHRVTIEKFLQEKVLKKMQEATPHDARWYRTDAQLGCRSPSDEVKMKKATPKPKAELKEPKADPKKEPKADPKGGKRSSSSSADSSDDSSSASPKKRKK